MSRKVIKPGTFNYYSVDIMRDQLDEANEKLILSGEKVDVVFIGDSITANWKVSEVFTEFGNVINRGVSGDVIEIVEKRFEADALQLQPEVIVLSAGSNDTYSFFRTVEEDLPAEIERQFKVFSTAYEHLVDLCCKLGQKVIVGAITPMAEQPSPATIARKETVVRMNKYLEELCTKYKIPFADYHTAMAEFDGKTAQPCLTQEGLHPNLSGYERMDRVIRPILRAYLSNK